MKEEWKPINGYEGIYLISNFGRVKSLGRINCPQKRGGADRDKILSPRNDKLGYSRVLLYSLTGKKKQFKTHRLVAMHFIPNPNNYPLVNHIDENPANNYVNNLEWCTHSYNIKYSIERSGLKGRVVGSRAEMDIEKVLTIVTLNKSGWNSVKISKGLGINKFKVYELMSGNTYKYWTRGLI